MYLYVRCTHLYPRRLDHKFWRIWLKSPQSSRAEINSLSYKSPKFQRKCHTLGTTLLTPCSNWVNTRSTSWKHDAAIGGILRGTLEHNTALTVSTHFHYSEKHNRDTTSCAKSYGTKKSIFINYHKTKNVRLSLWNTLPMNTVKRGNVTQFLKACGKGGYS